MSLLAVNCSQSRTDGDGCGVDYGFCDGGGYVRGGNNIGKKRSRDGGEVVHSLSRLSRKRIYNDELPFSKCPSEAAALEPFSLGLGVQALMTKSSIIIKESSQISCNIKLSILEKDVTARKCFTIGMKGGSCSNDGKRLLNQYINRVHMLCPCKGMKGGSCSIQN
ncbi:acyl-CoA N-acyltransferases super family protein [Striga asiatica]|uniref:Acyl-CoA N-acyltransferases super family protein n=1 Tax=Striga asiatica TaxID=4170 RepID=A0A5A7PAR5_STRAF|nr:acyl-CoA N-acyltransferases super family protein [Striga asiatica]